MSRYVPLPGFTQIGSIHVSAYIESVTDRFAPQTIKQRLAALRGLFDWPARLGILESNPASPELGRLEVHGAPRTPPDFERRLGHRSRYLGASEKG